MKILYIVSSPYLNPNANTGYGRHIRETVSGLQRIGHEVRLLTAADMVGTQYESEEIQAEKKWIKVFFKSLIPSYVWETIKDIRQMSSDRRFRSIVSDAIDDYSPQLVYERTCYLSNVISVNSTYKLPWLLEVNAPFVEEREKISGGSFLLSYGHRFEQNKCTEATHVFCVSRILAQFIEREYGVDNQKLTVNHNGVNPLDFQTVSPQSDINAYLTFGFVGSIMPYHGIEMLISAFVSVVRRFPSSQLLVVGDGQILTQLKEFSRMNDISDNVCFTGGISFAEVGVRISEMDVCIMPSSNWYGSPVKIFEYGVFGKPIIAPRVKPLEELIVSGQDGLLVDDEEDLTKAMLRLIEEPKTRNEIGEAFKAKVLSHYTWTENVQRINEIIVKHSVSN